MARDRGADEEASSDWIAGVPRRVPCPGADSIPPSGRPRHGCDVEMALRHRGPSAGQRLGRGRFFEAAAAVYRLSPWQIMQSESQVLRLDAPGFGVENACLSVVGGLDEHYGVPNFESVDDFSDTAMAEVEGVAGGQSASVPVLSINFGGRKELPRRLARQAKRHAWPVAGPRAYPWILAVAVDGLSRPITERDYAYTSALLEALAVFLREHAAAFAPDPAAPCPCGSGVRYRKCCMPR